MTKPTKIYAEVLEDTALEQFNSAMAEDYAVRGALMPDAHTGYSLPIGAVVATEDHILPSWVGYDIGCGMCALSTTFDPVGVRLYAQEIFNKIYEAIPTGPKNNSSPTESSLNPDDLSDIGREVFDKRGGFFALGSLGGGNHFIEIGEDQDHKIWIVIHSGSRGPGHGIAGAYMRLASGDGKAREGHYSFTADSELGHKYINDLAWGLEFALQNRREMISRVEQVIAALQGGEGEWDDLINRNHNHAEQNQDGLWVHRKGATHAEEGMMGVIPGNMRDGSFIVRGKGNPESICSSSHGAGRVLGRKQAKRELNVEQFTEEMKDVVARVGERTLDEAPMVYKDIFEVMRLQKDLVDTIAHVRPIINVKG